MASRRVSIERRKTTFFPPSLTTQTAPIVGHARSRVRLGHHQGLGRHQGGGWQKDEHTHLLGYIASLCAVGYPPIFMPDKYDASDLIERIDKSEDDNHGLFVARPTSQATGVSGC